MIPVNYGIEDIKQIGATRFRDRRPARKLSRAWLRRPRRQPIETPNAEVPERPRVRRIVSPTLIDEVSTLSLEESRMKRLRPGLTMLTLVLSFNAVRAADGPSVTPFEADGVVADVLDLFPCAIKDNKKTDRARSQTTLKEVAARALVTKDGVYAFLETPENKKALKGVRPGTAVNIKGRLLASGRTVAHRYASQGQGRPRRGFARYEEEEGKEVTLRALNKCQCGLNVADLPTLAHWATSIIWRPQRQDLQLPPVWRRQGGVLGRRDPLQERGA